MFESLAVNIFRIAPLGKVGYVERNPFHGVSRMGFAPFISRWLKVIVKKKCRFHGSVLPRFCILQWLAGIIVGKMRLSLTVSFCPEEFFERMWYLYCSPCTCTASLSTNWYIIKFRKKSSIHQWERLVLNRRRCPCLSHQVSHVLVLRGGPSTVTFKHTCWVLSWYSSEFRQIIYTPPPKLKN